MRRRTGDRTWVESTSETVESAFSLLFTSGSGSGGGGGSTSCAYGSGSRTSMTSCGISPAYSSARSCRSESPPEVTWSAKPEVDSTGAEPPSQVWGASWSSRVCSRSSLDEGWELEEGVLGLSGDGSAAPLFESLSQSLPMPLSWPTSFDTVRFRTRKIIVPSLVQFAGASSSHCSISAQAHFLLLTLKHFFKFIITLYLLYKSMQIAKPCMLRPLKILAQDTDPAAVLIPLPD